MIATSACIVLSGSALAFDFQATTPCAAEVVEAMAPFWSADWGNPSSRQHRLGLSASAAVKLARRQLAEAVGVEPERLVFTSEATQAPDRSNGTDHRLEMNGNSLPAAWILMRQGTVALANNAELNGIVWTHSFCSNNYRLVLNEGSRGMGSGSNLKNATDLWNWSGKGFAGYGRKTTRGIRGTGLDQFQRF